LFSSILHLVQGTNVVELTAVAPSGGDRCGRRSVAAVDGCSVDHVETTGGVHGVGALVSHWHNFG
jgi:hypothetical protein